MRRRNDFRSAIFYQLTLILNLIVLLFHIYGCGQSQPYSRL
jgi:hypothetical protein